MKKIIISLLFVAILSVLIMPAVSLAQNAPLVPCNNNSGTMVTTTDSNGNIIASPCNFNAFMHLINNIINFILVYMTVPIAAIMFAYAGFELVTAGGESAHARTKAKNIFTNAIIGLVLALAAWLVVHTILSILGFDGSWIGL